MKKYLIPIIVIGCFLCILFGLAIIEVKESPSQMTNHSSNNISTSQASPTAAETSTQAAPDFTLQTLDGSPLSLSDVKGKPTLIYFWTSWCGYCKKEMPSIQAAYQEYKDNVNIITINITSSDSLEQVQQSVRENQFTFPVLLDEDGTVSHTYQVLGTPTSFLLNKDGAIERKFIGNMPPEELEQWLKQSK